MDKIQSAINRGDGATLAIIDKDVEKRLKKLKYKVSNGIDPGEKYISWRRGEIK